MPTKTIRFRVKSSRKRDYLEKLEKEVRETDGVRDFALAESGKAGIVSVDTAQISVKEVFNQLERRGFSVQPRRRSSEEAETERRHSTLLRLLVAAAFSMQIMLIYLSFLYRAYGDQTISAQTIQDFHIFLFLLTSPVLWYGGYPILIGAFSALKRGTANMNTLVSLGLLAAYGYSLYITWRGEGEAYFDAVGMITTVIMIGRYIETLGGDSARKGIRSLMKMQPETATRRQDGSWITVPVSKLEIGDEVLVRSGERVPADLKVKEGQGSIDSSLLTGESDLRHSGAGDTLPSGVLITDGTLSCEVIAPSADSRLARITRHVSQILKTSVPVQRLADTASKYLTFTTLGIAIAAGTSWYLLAGAGIEQALLIAVAVLVAACPCALGMATPLAIVIAIAEVSHRGIIVRRSTVLETAAGTDLFVFDKTGTLTRGGPAVGDVLTNPDSDISRDELLALAAAAEQGSDHPVARAIAAAAEGPLPEAVDFSEKVGAGITARVEDPRKGTSAMVYVGRIGDGGNSDILPPTLADFAVRLRDNGSTAVAVRRNEEWTGVIGIKDSLVPEAAAVVGALEALGVDTMLLSGDHPGTVNWIADRVSIRKRRSGLSPEEKGQIIGTLRNEHGTVAMIGDGVNDGPALAQASWSVTVASGTDVAGETSDMLLTTEDLTSIPWFIRASKRTRTIILENLGWALGYNLIVLPLAAFGYLRPVIAALLMAISSLIVVGNSLRLRRILSVAVQPTQQIIDAKKGKKGKEKTDRGDDT